jgi:hypothetical protein
MPTIRSYACALKLNQPAFSPTSDPPPPAGGCTRSCYAVPPEIVTRPDAAHAEMQPGRIGFERDRRHCYGRRRSFSGATGSCEAGWAGPLACRRDGKSSPSSAAHGRQREVGGAAHAGEMESGATGATARRTWGDGEGIGRFETDRRRCYGSFGYHRKNPIGRLKRKKTWMGWLRRLVQSFTDINNSS